ncbi:ammonium transporter [Labilibaculum sp. K2S]|uniref:ammonium transporter n=1 Tax=Labilibaculum sp. K2S TaxID=3056386 RepID=UPI0025A32EAF|nr:ammonium transporter [Labilibaculum sp. K2S]MDM8161979.1 ammonium transporter [Labilibaculum sp. K2S]
MEETLTLNTLQAAVAETGHSIDIVWVLIATALVMFMQPGFAMAEAGFTRSKNTANILMKNLVDFAVGSIAFFLIGYALMFGTDIGGLIGKLPFMEDVRPDIDLSFLMFQTVFAATAATIVSGAVAERTEFKAYILFSIVTTAIVYPISGHWIWGGGWLSNLGFHDFAGSTVVHSVGAWMGLVGAAMIGPRIGKYNGKVNAIPGHNLTFAALGVFILWFGWFGFNAGSQLAANGTANTVAISHIFLTTNLSAAAGTLAALLISWIRYNRPTLSLSLNGSLAGLVAITAGCDIVSPESAIIIGLIAGTALVFGVELIDKVLRIDDPVGAVTVHGINGALGTILVGFFAKEGGVFYGGGFSLLGVQVLGVVAVAAWALGTAYIIFKVLKVTVGLRVSARIEEEGLDIYEHGEKAYQ